MAIANTGAFGNHFDADINDIFFDEYVDYGTEYDQIVTPQQAPAGNHYTESELTDLEPIAAIAEGAPVTFDSPIEGNKKTIYYSKFGRGFQITQEMVKDDLFRNFTQMPAKLAKSAAYKRETEFFDLFNTAFVTTNHTAWDALAICDNTRTTLKSGTAQDNDPTGAALSETTMQSAFEYFDGLVSGSGLPVTLTPWKLVTDVSNRWLVGRLNHQGFNIGSGNRDDMTTNAVNGYVQAWSPHLSRHMVDTDRWFLIAKEHDMRFYWKEQASLESQDDFATGNAMFKTIMRFACFVMDPKGIYGNAGT